LAVVDPNVGKDREVAIETDSGRLLVGPDHGLLTRA
jgi:S-adenosylmethionine hydrolase